MMNVHDNVLRKLQHLGLTLNTYINMQEVSNGVTNHITGEIMTNYKKVIACPQICETWLKTMCKELGQIAQGYADGNKINEK